MQLSSLESIFGALMAEAPQVIQDSQGSGSPTKYAKLLADGFSFVQMLMTAHTAQVANQAPAPVADPPPGESPPG